MLRFLRTNLLITLVLATCTLLAAQANSGAPQVTFTILHNFTGGADGGFPEYAALIPDSAGNLYGTTIIGGTNAGACAPQGGCGTIYKIDPAGNLSVFYTFSGATDGPRSPYGTLTRDTDGTFYGTTLGGGTSGNGCNGYGCGTVFAVNASGQEHTIYNFTGLSDGATPTAPLAVGIDGRGYSTTHNGGIQQAGVVFAIDKQGNESVVHSFNPNVNDGFNTWSGLIRDPSGNFYGMTLAGGGFNANCLGLFGCGTIYEIMVGGTEKILYRFTGESDGQFPYGGLIRDADGTLYGASQGGTAQFGTIFKLDPQDNFIVLHTFTGGAGGGNPLATLVRDSNGTFYGTTSEGGGNSCPGGYGCGTVFALTSSGQFTVLHSFSGYDGWNPSAPLTILNGALYGTAANGGAGNEGVVFKISR